MCDDNNSLDSSDSDDSVLSDSNILSKIKNFIDNKKEKTFDKLRNLYIAQQSIDDEIAILNTRKNEIQSEISVLIGLSKYSRQENSYTRPKKISKELSDFIGAERGIMVSRTDVSRIMCRYIRENKLASRDNGRIINPDDKLRKLLHIQQHEQLTFFNIQKYINPHFYDF
jgi:chromatin remodeling complex protein RSC6